MEDFYRLSATDIRGQLFDFDTLRGKVVLIVNTASKCGFTPQFEGLEKLYQAYKDQGLMVLGFPCNQFGRQDPGSDAEIGAFCQKNYGVSFQMMRKIEVNGEVAHIGQRISFGDRVHVNGKQIRVRISPPAPVTRRTNSSHW